MVHDYRQTNPTMTFRISDFVNREEALAILWRMVRQETVQRVLLVHGPDLIGKTCLLDEFQQECRADRIASVLVDFEQRAGESYLTIITSVANQLGWEGFEHLTRVFKQVRAYSALEASSTLSAADRARRPDGNAAPAGERAGGVDFHAPAEIHRDVVGRDVNYVTQIVQYEHPLVQQTIQSDITSAFQKCLVALTTMREVVFLFDHWDRANPDTGNWICDTLLNWILENQLPRASAVVVNPEVPHLHNLFRYIERFRLTYWTDETILRYWVEKRRLPPEALPAKIYARLPGLLAIMAQQYDSERTS